MPTNRGATIDFSIALESGGPTFEELVGRPATQGQFAIEVCYRDSVQASPNRATFYLESAVRESHWVVNGIEYLRDDDAGIPIVVQIHGGD